MALKLKRNVIEDYHSEQEKVKKYTILLVDDEEANLTSLTRILETDYNIVTATDGTTALETLKAISPPNCIHLIISDQRMPQMNGVEFLTKSIQISPDSLRVILTGFADVNAIMDAVNYSAVYKFLTKPIEATEIRLTAQKAVESFELLKKNHRLSVELQELNKSLELKVEERSKKLIEYEKMAALGQLIAGIAHEINTPLGAINSSASNMQKLLAQTLNLMPKLFQAFTDQECEEFLSVLNRALHSDISLLSAKDRRQKRCALVELLQNSIEHPEATADVLVDIGIYTDVTEIIDLLKKDRGAEILELIHQLAELSKGTRTINIATERAAKVVKALKSYSHQDRSGEKINAYLTDGIETILTLYSAQMRESIILIKNYADNLPMIKCYPDELNQVWTNLIHNALQAMNYQGTLTINAAKVNDCIKVEIQDSGIGISPENREKIFEAFFTTKASGEGSGLGLYIIKKIIDKHAGQIDVNSEPGCTIFSVLLPINKV